MTIHLIKLIVGLETLEQFAIHQQDHIVDYHGQPVNTVWTRHMPKRADEIIRTGGSIYRIIKSRIICRQKIIGFEAVETKENGRMCLMLTETQIYKTIAAPHRPFQGWRYFQQEKTPKDIGPYDMNEQTPPEEMAKELEDLGLL